MPFRDRLRKLRKGSASAENSPPAASTPDNGTSTSNGPSTGEQTPAMTKTPTANSTTDLNTIGDVLTHQATLKAQAEGSKKKKRGLFRRKDDPYKDWPEDVYRPNEVPAPKYRRTPDPKHTENLSSFSFGGTASNFMRRFSMQSGVSPGGSRRASRMGSLAPSQNPSRQPSVADSQQADDSGIGSPSRDPQPLKPGLGNRGAASRPTTKAAPAQHVENIKEEEDENSISRQQTGSDKENKLETAKTHSQDMPFTQQELTQALSKANIAPEATKA